MSDQSPPPTKPKPGSLRDRIAAFENKSTPATSAPGSGTGTGTAAPAPRPKPGNLQWKPKAPSPPPTPPDQTSKIAGVGRGMSASDAKESISRGGTLKERMAALQGKGGFGAPVPPPALPTKPVAVEKPKWKPPPVISPPPADNDEVTGRAASRSPPFRRSTSPPSDVLIKADEARSSPPPEGDRTSPDPEDEERQRRAAIAARMARLGGARIGMAPPVIAPKPVVRKPTAPAPESKQEEYNVESPEANRSSDAPVEGPIRELVGSSSAKEETAEEYAPSPERRDSDQASIGSSSSNRTPAAMPVPAAPRRAAPPRRKTFKSAPSTPLPEVPVSASGSEEPDSEPVIATSPPPSSASPLSVTEAPKMETSQQLAVTLPIEALTGEGHHEVGRGNKPTDMPDDSFLSGEGGTAVVLMERPETIVNEPEGYVEEEGHAQELEAEGQGSLKGSSAGMTADDEHGYVPSVQEFSSHVYVEAEPVQEKELRAEQEQDEDEQDDEVRRKRVAARLAQMGAFNPLAGPTPIPRRTSIEEPHSKEGQFDVEDEANVDTEEVGECVLSPPTAATPPAVHHVDEEFKHGHVSAEAEERNLDSEVERDDEHEAEFESTPTAGNWITHRVLYHNTGVDDDDDEEGQQRISSPSLGHEAAQPYLEGRPAEVPATDQDSSDDYSNRDDLGEPRASATEAELDAEGQVPDNLTDINASGSVSFTRPDNQSSLETGVIDDDGRFVATEKEEDDNMAPPRITRPIPPPPVNFGLKPPLVPFSASSMTAVPSLKDEDEDRAVSPDIPPRPIPPPPVRSVPDAVEGELPVRPRHSIPPPPRRSSLRMTEPVETPPTPPPVPTLPRPMRRPTSPPILTALPTLQVSERVGGSEEPEVSASESQETQGQETEDGDEAARRRTIAERMARLGGIRFGVPAPMHHLSRAPMPPVPPPTSIPPDDSESEAKEDDVQLHEEEDEAARKERIRAKIAEIGGIRFGERPPTVALPAASARRLVSRQEDSESEDSALPVPVPPPQRVSSIRRPPPSFETEPEQSSLRMSEGVKLEAGRSGAEEMQYSGTDVLSGEEEGMPPPLPPARRKATTSAPIDALPTPPPRSSPIRPPIPGVPASLLNRRASTPTGSVPSSRKSSTDYTINADTPIASSPTRTSQEPVSSEISFRPQSEYVMVEAEPGGEETPVPPPRRPTRVPPPPRSIPLPPPPPPSAIDPPEEFAGSNQWELPSIPQGAEFIADSDLASSGWSDDSTAVHFQPPPPPLQAPVLSIPVSCGPTKQTAHSGRRSTSSVDRQLVLGAEELMAVWGKIGVKVVEAASDLFEKSKRSLVGDGSYPGFVRAALAQVPEALRTSDPEEWGYVIYAQTGAMVQRRIVDIMPGDVISFWDAKLKGHKSLHAYSQTVGTGESGALVGIVHEFEAKKSKVRVWQANQHVGQQSVEIVSYRLEDLKSGNVKVFRVLENAT